MLGLYLALVILISVSTDTKSIVIKEVSRSIDISTQLVVIKSNLTLWNQQDVRVNKIQFITEPYLSGTLAYMEASSETVPLKIVEDGLSWHVILIDVLHPGQQAKLSIKCVYINKLIIYPTHVEQHESQLVLFKGNIFFYGPYFVENQITLIRLPSEIIESYTHFEPVSQFDTFLAYGPYKQIAPYSFQELNIHCENNAPFLVVTKLKRNIEVSHWGNIAVEEFIELEHRGAALKGPFSRYDYQFQEKNGLSSVWKYVTVLPASAKDIYYRDEIGNISSSLVTYFNSSVHMHLQLRFPLFGGWKINYIVGYNLPTDPFLYRDGNNFLLRMNAMDNIFKSMVVENLETKIVLPEHSGNLNVSAACAAGNFKFGKHFTYLDIVGRPTIEFTCYNLVENHLNTFDLQYTFPSAYVLMEALYLCLAIFIAFVAYIFVSRSDFEIQNMEIKKRRRYRRKKN